MSKTKKSGKKLIKWHGEQVYCYYDSILLLSKPFSPIKFYHEFSRNKTEYRVGDFATIKSTKNRNLRGICLFKCLFEEKYIKKAVVNIYKFTSTFKEKFDSLKIEIDEDNEVVFDPEEVIISLDTVVEKCRVIIGSRYDSVTEEIDVKNLNRKFYFLCRFQHIGNGELVPALDAAVINNITIVKESNEIEFEYSSHNKTPSKFISDANGHFIRKNIYESMDIDDEFHAHHLDQVKRNLSSSFNEILSDDDNPSNYSIVQSSEDDLKMKLRISKGKVLTNLPKFEPVVLLESPKRTPLKSIISRQDNAIYELRSPTLSGAIKKTLSDNVQENQKLNKLTDDGSKLTELSNMVSKLTIPKSPSPRKLRRLSCVSYAKNLGGSDNENQPERRKSLRTRKKINYEESFDVIKTPLITRKSIKKFKAIIESSEDECSNESSKIHLNKRTNNYECHFNDEISDNEPINSTENSKETRNKLDNMKKSCDTDEDCDISKKSPRKRPIGFLEVPNVLLKSKTIDKNESRTPKCGKSVVTGRGTPKTPSKTPLKLIREGVLTPSIDQRRNSVVKPQTPLLIARNSLHVSYVPSILPCREKEYEDVYNFIKGKLLDKCGGCMYISGVPGTGKTATVTAAIENVTKDWKNEGYPPFNYININGMRLTEPRQCYVEIIKQLTGKQIPWEQALSSLENKFCVKSSKKVVPTVLVVDELDILCTKRQDVVYNLLDWPTKTNAQLIVVTIANTMDLPERLLISRVTSRLGLTRLTFQAYTFKQLQEIVINRLAGNNSFKADAIQFVARKVASVSGDARRALDICRRSAEIAEAEGPHTQVSMKHVNSALDAMMTQPKVKAIMHCSRLEKLLLQSVIAEVERTGVEETVFADVYSMLISLAALDGFKMVSVSLAQSAIYRLGACKLLLVDQKSDNLNQRIILNVSSDDVHYALKNN